MEKQMDKTNFTCVTISQSPISDFLMGIYILAFILGLAFNLLTLGPIVQQVRSQNVLGVFLLNLSLSDILYILTMPLWINYYHRDHHWSLGSLSCSVAGFFYYSNMYLSIYLLCCISVDRYLAITYPLRSKAFRSIRYAWVLCLVLCAAVMSAHSLVLFKDNLQDAHDDKLDRCYETYPMPKPVALFNLLRVGIGFLLPLLVLGLCYWRILGQVKQSEGLGEQVKRKVRLLSFGVMGIFSVCFAPYHLLLLTRSLAYYYMDEQRYCEFEEIMHFPFLCTLALSSLNSVVDPVLYVLVSNGVREDMRLCCCGNRKSQRDKDSSVIAVTWKTHTSMI
ncbi:G-protein coupled receptor 4 [Salmo trutta]|uniref:G protein-coupled receptor 184 n=1 Tax=Salmo trutta TaxID=8032 RepID=A0A673XWH5_SALTR|nr:G-protein coupled receptor 4-like [Salmo trutta]XP_029570426.1 G-protein coupled receptor 4-like [Salmo trutta]